MPARERSSVEEPSRFANMASACHFITGFPPGADSAGKEEEIFPWFVAPAVIVGLLSMLVLLVSGGGSPLAKVIGPVLLVIFWALVSRGKNLLAMGALVERLVGRFFRKKGHEDDMDLPISIVAIGLVTIVKLALLGMLIHGRQWGIIFLVPVCSVYYAAELSAGLGYLGGGLKGYTPARLKTLCLFLLLGLLALFNFSGLFMVGVIWLIVRAVTAFAWYLSEDLHEEIINGGTELVELLVILVAASFLFAS